MANIVHCKDTYDVYDVVKDVVDWYVFCCELSAVCVCRLCVCVCRLCVCISLYVCCLGLLHGSVVAEVVDVQFKCDAVCCVVVVVSSQ